MRLGIEVVAGQDVLKALTAAGGKSLSAIKLGIRKCAMLVERKAKETVYDGHPEHLEGDKGGLRRSITVQYVQSGLTAHIGPNVVYAAIHEFGGTIVPKTANYLRFKTKDGAWHTVSKVTIPARPYMRPALAEEQPRFGGIMANTLLEGIGLS